MLKGTHRQRLLRTHYEKHQSLLCVHIKVHPIALIGSNGYFEALQEVCGIKKNISKIFTHLKVELIGHVVENHTIGEYHYHIGNDYDGLSYGLSL